MRREEKRGEERRTDEKRGEDKRGEEKRREEKRSLSLQFLVHGHQSHPQYVRSLCIGSGQFPINFDLSH